MISFDEAIRLVAEAARPIATETVRLEEAAGRIIAEPVGARVAAPRADVSAMDGYAVRDADLTSLPARLKLIGESFAGNGWSGEIGERECVRIFTGAPVPTGADRVVIQENVRRDGETAIIDEPAGSARHIRKRGGDFVEGDILLQRGQLLHSRAMVAAAAADVAKLVVFTQPWAYVLSTGDELAAPGTAAKLEGAIPESVSFGVAALAKRWGAMVTRRKRLRDDLGEMQEAAAEAVATSDIVIVTGGASVGEKDFAKTMFEPLGLDLIFSKVAMKPGKPVWLGRIGNVLVMGLPGNPTSALVTGRLLLAPLLCGLAGRDVLEALPWRSAPLAEPLASCGPRETFHRAHWTGSEVELLSNQDSSAQRALVAADLVVRQRANSPDKARGADVDVLPF